jgi:hypothetical protein
MTEELSLEARDLIERAVREEAPASSLVLAKIRRQVISAGAAAGAVSVAGKVAAASGGSVLAGSTSASIASSVFTSLLLGAALGVGVTVGPQLFDSTEPPVPSAPSEGAGVSPAGHGTRGSTRVAPSEPLEQSASDEAARPSPARTETPKAGAFPTANAPARRSPPPRKPESQIAAASERVPAKGPENTAADRPATASGADLRQELALLERVQGELRAGNGARALELLDERPATRQLTTEYLAAEVFAACQIGQRERARSAAERFLRLHPAGPLATRVRNSCAGEKSDRLP